MAVESKRLETASADAGRLRIYFLPNLMTGGNLFCGFVALTKIVEADLASPTFNSVIRNALFFILLACIFDLLDGRVARWNELATAAGLVYPRYDGGFFTTVFCPESAKVAARLKEDGIFVVPVQGALRVGLCSVPERDIERLVNGFRKAMNG